MEPNEQDAPGQRQATEQQSTSAGTPAEPSARPARLVSLDAYRGFVMIMLAAGGFGIAKVARQVDGEIWQQAAFHFTHPDWISQFKVVGCSFWDLIQPSFMFMVGVAMPFSYARRMRQGQSRPDMWAHAATRAVVLVLLGVFLSSQHAKHTNFSFANVLCQIGLGYLFVFALLGRRFLVQLLAAVVILVGYWLLFVLYPTPGAGFDYAAAGIDIQAMPELFQHWAKNANAAWRFDVWFLNLFPRPEPFEANPGGYCTLNFVPAIVTMLLGMMAGDLLRGPRGPWHKLALLVLGGAVCMGLAVAASYTVCPVVKRIWTPSWTLFAGAWTLWILAAFYLVIDVAGLKKWSFPLVVVGMNSIIMYLMAMTMKGWIAKMLTIHFGQDGIEGTYGPIVQSLAVLAVLWLICWWLYR